MADASEELEKLSRDELIAHARKLGVQRAEVMTRVELKDEIVRRIATDETSRRRARGWLGVARDLVASLIEQGLNMPDAAKLVRSSVRPTEVRHQPPVATVTLAEIYATQGHLSRALSMLDEVLDKEPDHGPARTLRDRLRADAAKREPRRAAKLEPEPEPELDSELDSEWESEPPIAHASQPEIPEPPPPPEPERVPEPVPTPEPQPVPSPEPQPVPTPEPQPVPTPEPQPVPSPEPQPVPEPVPEPPIMLPARPRPPARDVVVTIGTDDGGVWIYWELGEASRVRAKARWPGGHARIQLVAMVPRWEGARRFEREIDVESPTGSAWVPPFEERAVVRAALGWRSKDGFHPLAVGTELAPPNGAGDGARVRWAPSARTTVEPPAQDRALACFVASRAT